MSAILDVRFTMEPDHSKAGKRRKARAICNGLPPFRPYKWRPKERTEAMKAADRQIEMDHARYQMAL